MIMEKAHKTNKTARAVTAGNNRAEKILKNATKCKIAGET